MKLRIIFVIWASSSWHCMSKPGSTAHVLFQLREMIWTWPNMQSNMRKLIKRYRMEYWSEWQIIFGSTCAHFSSRPMVHTVVYDGNNAIHIITTKETRKFLMSGNNVISCNIVSRSKWDVEEFDELKKKYTANDADMRARYVFNMCCGCVRRSTHRIMLSRSCASLEKLNKADVE